MDSQDKKKYHKKGISLKLIAWIIAAFVFVISSALVSISILIVSQNQKVNQVTSNYITLKQASTDIQGASDYLTSQVRLFVANADKKYMDNYFEEADVTQRRQNALATVHKLSEQTPRHEDIHKNLALAVDESMDLMNVEFFAMKLVCVDAGISCDEYQEVYNVDISSVDPANRRSVALNSVLDQKYMNQKDKITNHINAAFEIIDDFISEHSKEAGNNLRLLIISQSVVIGINVAFAIAVVLLLLLLIVKPMNSTLHAIENNEEIHVHSNREFNYLVDAYNDSRSLNEKVKEKLTYEAEHDKLTNLYNRTGYVSLYKRIRLSKALYILLDVDKFKEINDEYGHDVGDKVLIRIAETLDKRFIEDNAYVFRIGGDEFAVIIENCEKEIEDTIVDRCEKINYELSVAKGKIPQISLSIGIAHGDEDDTTDSLFKKADNALYKVKKSGKSGVIYEKN